MSMAHPSRNESAEGAAVDHGTRRKRRDVRIYTVNKRRNLARLSIIPLVFDTMTLGPSAEDNLHALQRGWGRAPHKFKNILRVRDR